MEQQNSIEYIDYSIIQNQSQKKLKDKRRKKVLPFLTITIVLILSAFIFFYQTTNQQQSNLPIIQSQTFQQQLIQISSPIISLVTNLTIISSVSSLHIDSQKYPNLKHLHINNQQLSSLKIQMELQSLVIQNSKLVSFSYNSTELKYLQLLNNNKMTSFINSTLPSLLNLTIYKSNINTWHSNSFSHIQYILLKSLSIKNLPQLTNSTGVGKLTQSQCSFSISNGYFQNNKINQFESIDSTHQGGLSISNSSYPKSIIIQNSNFLFILIQDCQSLNYLSISNISTISYLYLKNLITPINIEFDNIGSIGSISLINITISDLYFLDSVQHIIELLIRQVPLKTFKHVPLTLEVLSIDYQMIKQKQFSLSSQILKQLTIENYETNYSFNTKSLENLQRLVIQNCALKNIQIEYKNMESILIWNVKGYSDNDLDIILKGNKISRLTLLEVQNIRKFENKNFKCDHFTLRETSIQRMQNNNISTAQMIIENNTQMEYIGGNTIQVATVKFRWNSKLKISEQIFLNAKQVEIQHCKELDIKKINSIFPIIEDLIITSTHISQVSNISVSTLKYLSINDQTLTNFSYNNLLSLRSIILSSNVTYFINNTLPDLSTLNLLQGNTNLNFSLLIEQLTSMKENNTPLTLIELPNNVLPQVVTKIKELFPNANIVVH